MNSKLIVTISQDHTATYTLHTPYNTRDYSTHYIDTYLDYFEGDITKVAERFNAELIVELKED